jgi:glycyl-tRNA synthetase beta chain
MRLPPKVLVTAMQSHQRYFPLEEPDGSLHPAFLAISNGDPAHSATITRGNEGVLSARLQDATFSFEKDMATGLDALDAKLDTIVFHQRLGTLADKRDRLVKGVQRLGAILKLDSSVAVEAARLSKVDQGAVLVAEFSDLQGYAASHYAALAGHSEAVCRAIEDQYLPEGPESPTPSSEAGALLACAEKIDNLVGAFAIDEAPTSSKDPYGLRRAAAGLVRIALERGWDLDADSTCFLDAYGDLVGQGADLTVLDLNAFESTLRAFVNDRLAFHLAQEGVGAEAVNGAIGAKVGGLAATAEWARSVQRARDHDAFWAAWEACNRCVRIAAKGPEANGAWSPAGDVGEQALADALAASRPRIDAAREARDFDAALDAGAAIAPAVDTFFSDVLVNADDPVDRARRYALVREAAHVLGRIADFTAITQGGTR